MDNNFLCIKKKIKLLNYSKSYHAFKFDAQGYVIASVSLMINTFLNTCYRTLVGILTNCVVSA